MKFVSVSRPAAFRSSHKRHYSTIQNAGGLYFWDRNETRCIPSAMAAEPKKIIIKKNFIITDENQQS
jgi:hypothetical protein